MRTLHVALATLLGAAILVACSGREAAPEAVAIPPSSHDVAKSSLARDLAPAVSGAELEDFAAANYAFTAGVIGRMRTSTAKDNFVVSPFSVSVALSMPYAGAKGVTASEMASTLRWQALPQPRVSKVFDWATLELASRADQALATATAKGGATPPDAGSFRLHVVNSVWADRRVTFASAFLDTMAVDYGAGVTLADFVGNPEGERAAINAWVSDETLGKIQQLLPAGSVRADTRLVLVDALHLKLPWASPLDLEPARKDFILAGGGGVSAAFVRTTHTMSYYEDANVQAVSLPLEGRKVSMLFVLPKGSLDAFEAALTGETLASLFGGMTGQPVSLELPKFRFETPSVSLKGTLEALGMKTPFSGAADFSGIGRAEKALSLGDVQHKAMIGLDEKGLEAAAATAVVVYADAGAPSGPPPATKTFVANRPFFFAVLDEPTRSVLFAGHVVDPTR